MHVVGPVVAADSESILRIFCFVGASCAASVAPRGLTLARFGKRVKALSIAAGLFSDSDAPPGLRHRRLAPESA